MELDIIKKIFNKIESFVEYLSMGTLVVLVCIVFMQVFTRYFLKFTPRWSEETSVILMIWIGFISMAIGVKKGMHLSISAIIDLLPKAVQKIVYYFDEVAVLIFGAIMVRYGAELSANTMDSTLPATQLPSGVLYAIIPVAGTLIVFYTLIRISNLVLENKN